ncbi:adenosylhomocysteinase [Artemisia annua]|uniref:Adenosylhomocysteinase n=1 Tax=Artemisia annua TaxID=35608 RepID=A0A2U1N710_ARTAN|nr:adenosylhomocysteinase [Artemisia annua]
MRLGAQQLAPSPSSADLAPWAQSLRSSAKASQHGQHPQLAQLAQYCTSTKDKCYSIALMHGKYKKEEYVLPKRLDEEVAALHLGKLGAKLTMLSKDQAYYMSIPIEGPYKASSLQVEVMSSHIVILAVISSTLPSRPKSALGAPPYIAAEVPPPVYNAFNMVLYDVH